MKVMSVFGTRPEAIKMAPLVKELENRENIESIVTITAQHREMVDSLLKVFDIKADYDLNIMKKNQTIEDIHTAVLVGMRDILKQNPVDLLLVHGDTSTAFATALAGFYQKIPVAHIEAGLRSFDIYSPFPEEMNRKQIGAIASLHFSPTLRNKQNLELENIQNSNIFVTGNTVIDALKMVVKDDYDFKTEAVKQFLAYDCDSDCKKILLTAHRRENLGASMVNIFNAIKRLAKTEKIKIIYPMHPNPIIRELVGKMLVGIQGITLCEPLDYVEFSNLMSKCDLILSDSGGIQEEAPALGVPVLVLRKETERPEGVDAGTIKLVGVDESTIYNETMELLFDEIKYNSMSKAINPYGDGLASARIVDIIEDRLIKKYC